MAYKAALFFCVNPGSVLFLAPLTLTLTSAATFAAMASIEDGMGLFSGIYLAMATASQPCGVLTLLMVLYNSMRQVASQTILYVRQKKKSKTNNPQNKELNMDQVISTVTTIGISAIVPGIWCIVSSLAPFAAFQWFGFAAFCKLQKDEMANFPDEILDYAEENNLTMPGQDDKPEWCLKDPPIPYWYLGGNLEFKEPFIHWIPEDWPHYIACTPALVLVLWQTGQFFKMNKKFCYRLGLVDNTLLGMNKPKSLSWNLTKALPREALIYILQAVLIVLSTISLTTFQVI